MTQEITTVNNDWIPEVEKAVDEFINLEIEFIKKSKEKSKEVNSKPVDLPF